MDQSESPHSQDLEVQKLRQQLQAREQLVDQLSFELFRVMRAHPPMLAPAQGTALVQEATTPMMAKGRSQIIDNDSPPEQLEMLEEQIEFYQQQIDQRDAEIRRLQSSCQSLSDRNHMLEHVIQELPEVYRQKFADRLDQVKSKVQSLQLENQRLYSQLQGTPPPSSESQGLARLLPALRGKNTKKS